MAKLRLELLRVQKDTQESISRALGHVREKGADHKGDEGEADHKSDQGNKRGTVTRQKNNKRDREPVERDVVRGHDRTSKRQVTQGCQDDKPT